MPYQIEEIEGIGTTYGVRLRNIGINSTGLLLEKAGTKKSYISRIENGHADIQLSTLFRLIEKGLNRKLELTIQ